MVIVLTSSAGAAPPLRFKAHLEGFNLNGEPVPTNATGQATFEVIDNGTAIRYRVNVAGIRNLWMAHIHVAPAPVDVTDQRIQGNLASGVIYSDGQNLLGTVQELIEAMLEGRASVIVHTNAFGDPGFPMGEAGNSPPGELRGTIR
jgi:hypothetical protein